MISIPALLSLFEHEFSIGEKGIITLFDHFISLTSQNDHEILVDIRKDANLSGLMSLVWFMLQDRTDGLYHGWAAPASSGSSTAPAPPLDCYIQLRLLTKFFKFGSGSSAGSRSKRSRSTPAPFLERTGSQEPNRLRSRSCPVLVSIIVSFSVVMISKT